MNPDPKLVCVRAGHGEGIQWSRNGTGTTAQSTGTGTGTNHGFKIISDLWRALR